MSNLNWRYHDLPVRQNELLRIAVRQAKATAESIASALGTRCVAVHQFAYDFHGLDDDRQRRPAKSRQRKQVAFSEVESDLATELNFGHTTDLRVQVRSEFVVAPFASE